MPKKDDIVTKNYLDKRLAEHSQVIVSAVGELMDKKLGTMRNETDVKFNKLDTKLNGLERQINFVHNSLDKKIDDTKKELKADINNVQTLIDGYVKAQEDFKQEFVIMKEEVNKIKEFIKKKFKVEIKAI